MSSRRRRPPIARVIQAPGRRIRRRKKNNRQQQRPLYSFFRWVVTFLIIIVLALTVLVLFNPFIADFDLEELLAESRRASVILDRNGETVLTLNPSRVIWVSLERIPFLLRQAIVVLEDRQFYEHQGVNFRGILRAFLQNIRSGCAAQGGSTITQQLAKNIFLTNEKTISRKLVEAGYAVRIDQKYTKDQILEYYLNQIYFGHGIYGVEAASRFYFDRHVWELQLGELAMLAGLIRGPEHYSPFRNLEIATERRNLVMGKLRQEQVITEEEYRRGISERLRVKVKPENIVSGSYFADYVQEFLEEEYNWPVEFIRAGGLRIHTTLDLYIQKVAEEIIASLPANEEGSPQAALVALDPHTGEIRALVGGRNYRFSPINRVSKVYRQIGSAIKPLVFAAAVESGFTPETPVLDELAVYMINGRPWRPRNFDDQYRGYIPLRQALEESVNTVSVRLVHELGIKQVFSFIERMGLPLVASGVRNDQALAPLALGGLTKGVNLLELARSFTPLANQGVKSMPLAVLRVEDSVGRVLRRGRIIQEQVIQPITALMVTDMMKGVITRGTGRRANPGRPAAGKTGTSDKNTDAWFIGYTPELLAVLWIGNDDRSPLHVNGQVISSGTAAQYWGEFIKRALIRNPVTEFNTATR
ncbi:MAG TPA: PBP1A family penicillin-binding protein [Firmicutes bacterium]|nr:PBP1A family penicillin-binding protein [Bacillota bacterium]